MAYTRPLIVLICQSWEAGAVDTAEAIQIGKLSVPWTQDCSGLNLLIILLSLVVWVNREAPADRTYLLKIIAVFPRIASSINDTGEWR